MIKGSNSTGLNDMISKLKDNEMLYSLFLNLVDYFLFLMF